MKIYNKTNQVQELTVYDRNTNLPYSIYVAAKSCTDIDSHISAPVLPKLIASGIFQVLDSAPAVKETTPNSVDSTEPVVEDTKDETPEVVNEPEESLENPEDETSEESEDITVEVIEEHIDEGDVTKFICDVCGGEFASARGLARHKSSAHNS